MSDLRWLTTERLATLLSEEIDRDKWGDVDPAWIQMVAEGNYSEDDDGHDQAEALGKVLDRVIERLKYDEHPEACPHKRVATGDLVMTKRCLDCKAVML